MTFTSLNNLVEVAAKNGKKRVVVAAAQDEDVLHAIKSASEAGIATPLLVGDKKAIEIAAEHAGYDLSDIEVIHEPDSRKACHRAVGLIKEARADIIMKGLVSTTTLMRVLLDKDQGIVNEGLLSHVAFFETPYYHKIICITDAALNISPDLNEKMAIVKNAVAICHKLGMNMPCVAILAPVETVNPKIESTLHAALLTQMQKRNQIQGCIIDGPLALDNAVSLKAAEHKGLKSEVAGNADILVVPDLNAGNILYKSLGFLGGAVAAAIVAGASVPVVLTSRADNEKSKFLSIALAAALG